MRLPLRLKLSVLIISLLTVTVVLVSGFLLRTQQRTLTDEMSKRGLTIAQNLAASAKTALLTRDDLGLQLLVRDVARDGDVVYVVVTDSAGKVIAHSHLAQLGRALERPDGATPLRDTVLVQTLSLAEHGDVLDFSVPLVFRQVHLGAAYVGFSQTAIAQAVSRARTRAFVITLAMLAVGVGGAVGLAAALARPIVRLMQGTRAVADGDFAVTLPVTSRDELGTLTAAFNDMAPQPRREGDDQAGLQPLRGPRGRRRDPEGSRAARPHRGAARGHRALLRHPRLHGHGRAAAARRGRRAAQRVLRPHDRDARSSTTARSTSSSATA